MALIYRFCNNCGVRYGTRSHRSKFCGNTCTQAFCRQNKQRQLNIPEEPMKEEQREQATAEAIRDYVDRNIGRMTVKEMAENLGVSIYIVQRLMPNPSR